MNQGFYSYSDYSMDRHTIYIMSADDLHLHFLSPLAYEWMRASNLLSFLSDVPTKMMMRHVPHLQKENTHSFSQQAYETMCHNPLTKEDIPYVDTLCDFVERFEEWYSHLPADERFRTLVPIYKDDIPFATFSRLIQYLYNRYKTPQNRFRLLLHSGIQPFLQSKQEVNS